MAITSKWPLSLLRGIEQKKTQDFEFPPSCSFQECNIRQLSVLRLISLKDSGSIHLLRVHSLTLILLGKSAFLLSL